MRGTAFVAWTPVAGRPDEIARALGGEARVFYPRRLANGWRVPLRYALSAVATLAYLCRRRPSVVIATEPPPFAPLVCWGYCRAFGARLVLDSHPGAFGQHKRIWALLAPLHRRLCRRAAATLVTTPDLVAEVERLGGAGLLLHEAPPAWRTEAPVPVAGRPRLLFITVFNVDEPVDQVLEAARRLPGCDVRITGDVARADPLWIEDAPDNVTFTGWLDGARYVQELDRADVVLCLTDTPDAVLRGAHEAVWARRVLVLSDTPPLREHFPHAVHCRNDAAAIAAAVEHALDAHAELRAGLREAHHRQLGRWEVQLAALQALLAEPRR